MTATNEDVLQALLSLDAYNRNATNANMRLLGTADGEQLSPQIGSAEFKFSSDTLDNSGSTLQGSLLSGFSASYYTIGDQTVIAYRGTDFDTSSATSVFELLKDIATGWLASGGFIDPEHFDPLHAPNPAMDPPLEAKGGGDSVFPAAGSRLDRRKLDPGFRQGDGRKSEIGIPFNRHAGESQHPAFFAAFG